MDTSVDRNMVYKRERKPLQFCQFKLPWYKRTQIQEIAPNWFSKFKVGKRRLQVGMDLTIKP